MKVIYFVVVIQSIYLVATSAESPGHGLHDDTETTDTINKEISILVLGVSGSGISSTVEKLIKSPITTYTENSVPSLVEYSWKVTSGENNEETIIRVVDVPGLVHGKSDKHDARVLDTVRNYINDASGLKRKFPSVIIIVSHFDDKRVSGDQSTFIKTLKRIEMIKDVLFAANSTSNVIFHFTHLMTAIKSEQKKPAKIIDNFNNTIRNHTEFEPIFLTIGENKGEEFGLDRINDDIQLPNGERYPKNVIDAFMEVFINKGEHLFLDTILDAFNGNINHSVTVKPYSIDDATAENSSLWRTLVASNYEIDDTTEIWRDLEKAFESLDHSIPENSPLTLKLVQMTFQRLNISTRDQLPKTVTTIVELFQQIPIKGVALVQVAFALKPPEYFHPIIVGHGYDVLKDETTSLSPFVLKHLEFTSVGYYFPNITVCTMESGEAVEFKMLKSFEEYPEVRLNDLGLKDVNSSMFTGQVRSGYNIKPQAVDDFVGLKAVKEVRRFKLELAEQRELTENFIEDIQELTPFNKHNRDSPKEWAAFFNTYGTHLVSEAYGGGYFEGTARGDALRQFLDEYNDVIGKMKDTLIYFKPFPAEISQTEVATSHNFFGGSPNPKLEDAIKLTEGERDLLLSQWMQSVQSDPRILQTKLQLVTLSSIVSAYNKTIGDNVEAAMKLYLEGNLKYERRRSTPRPKPTFTTATPMYSVATTSRKTQTTETTTRPTESVPVVTETSTSVYPTRNSITSAPISQNLPTPKPEIADRKLCFGKTEDFTQNIVGQGYHVLKDAILPLSPFKLLNWRVNSGVYLPDIVSITKTRFIVCKTASIFYSVGEYTKSRLDKRATGYGERTPLHYKTVVRPGNTVIANPRISNGPFSSFEETRYLRLQIPILELNRTHLNDSFVEKVRTLPSYIDNKRNCTVVEKWLEFFDQYGTHYVSGGYAGTSEHKIQKGITLTEFSSDTKKFDGCADKNYNWDFDGEIPRHPSVAPESMDTFPIDEIIGLLRSDLIYDPYTVIHNLYSGDIRKACPQFYCSTRGVSV